MVTLSSGFSSTTTVASDIASKNSKFRYIEISSIRYISYGRRFALDLLASPYFLYSHRTKTFDVTRMPGMGNRYSYTRYIDAIFCLRISYQTWGSFDFRYSSPRIELEDRSISDIRHWRRWRPSRWYNRQIITKGARDLAFFSLLLQPSPLGHTASVRCHAS